MFLDNVLQVDSNDTLCGLQIRLSPSLLHATIHTVFQKLLALFRHQKAQPSLSLLHKLACPGTKHEKLLWLTPKLIDH